MHREPSSETTCCVSTKCDKIEACNVLGGCSDELIKDIMDESASTPSLSVDSKRTAVMHSC